MPETAELEVQAAHPDRASWRVAISIVSVLVAADLLFLVSMGRESLPADGDEEIAERFFDGLVVGNASADPDDAEGVSGYADAWSLVSERMRTVSGFEAFVVNQETLVNEYGFLDMPKKLEREWGDFRKRTLEYRLSFSGTRGRPREARCRITVVLNDSAYRVDAFEVTPENE